MSQSKFGDTLRLLRKRTGKSQATIVDEIQARFPEANMSQTKLSDLERRPKAPAEPTLRVLAAYYGIPVVDFFRPTSHFDDTVVSNWIMHRRLRGIDPTPIPELGNRAAPLDADSFGIDELEDMDI